MIFKRFFVLWMEVALAWEWLMLQTSIELAEIMTCSQ